MENEEQKPTTKAEEKKQQVEELSQVVKRLEEANQKKEDLLAKEEELTAKNLLGGYSNTGESQPEVKEETPQEYAKRVMSGNI